MKTYLGLALSAFMILSLNGCGDDGGTDGGVDGGDDGGNVAAYNATLVRTDYGVPHITADDWGSLGYGYGYAYAQDNYCVLMKEIVRANGQSMRYLGDDGSLSEDVVYAFYNSDEMIENEFIADAPANLVDLLDGYAAGFNRYFEETGADGLAEGDEGCRGADWVRTVTPTDLAKVYKKLTIRASTGPLAPLIAAAEAPTMTMAHNQTVAPMSIYADRSALELPTPSQLGSNAYAIGSNASQTGKGIVLGNPHFPWQGAERFYMAHLRIPGEYDVLGASLQGVPVINIGFNKDVAWTHTVSTGDRFTFYELTLKEGDPLTYIFDGEERAIVTNPVTIEIDNNGTIETVEEAVYTTHFGPIVDLGPFNAAGAGWPVALSGTVVAMRDGNIDNTRVLVQWEQIGKATSIAEIQEALKVLGVPWVNTIAADRAGTALYADVSTVPNVTQEKIDACTEGTLAGLIGTFGFVALDGNTSDCEWGNDPGAPEGLFGFDNLPKLVTNDYGANANDSYWLSNPSNLLTGFSPLIGSEEIPQSLRTRQTFVQAEERIAGTDDLGAAGFTVENMRELMWQSRNLAAELVLDDVLTICGGVADWAPYAADTAGAAQACTLLGSWDRLFNIDSVGPQIFFEFWKALRDDDNAWYVSTGDLWAVDFDAADPVNTPRDLDVANMAVVESVRASLGAAVDTLNDANIPLDRPWGQVQYREAADGTKIPIHGGSSSFMFSVISSNLVPDEGYSAIRHGNSYMHVVSWDDTDCPVAFNIISYSQSTDPASDHYSDMTELYSQKQWIDAAFCDADIEAAKISETVLTN